MRLCVHLECTQQIYTGEYMNEIIVETREDTQERRRARLITAYGCDMHLISNILAEGQCDQERKKDQNRKGAVVLQQWANIIESMEFLHDV